MCYQDFSPRLHLLDLLFSRRADAGCRSAHATTEAVSVCGNVLVHCDRPQADGDPKHFQRYKQALVHLRQLVATNRHLIKAVVLC